MRGKAPGLDFCYGDIGGAVGVTPCPDWSAWAYAGEVLLGWRLVLPYAAQASYPCWLTIPH